MEEATEGTTTTLIIKKTLGLIEYLVKNGAPRCIGDFKDEMFKIRTFSDFVLVENGSDRGCASKINNNILKFEIRLNL